MVYYAFKRNIFYTLSHIVQPDKKGWEPPTLHNSDKHIMKRTDSEARVRVSPPEPALKPKERYIFS